jgi:FixJ family two-component response regulator
MNTNPTVFVVDDDEAVRNSLQWLIQSINLPVETFSDAHEFLAHYSPERHGCLVLDVRLPGMSGLELQEQLAGGVLRIPVIIITGHGEVPMAVRAMRFGAFDFIEKPFNDQALLDQVRRAIEYDRRARERFAEYTKIRNRLDRLTPREREVLDMVVAGLITKEIAHQLSVAGKTVEVHRSHIMNKMQAVSVADLVRLTMLARNHERSAEVGDEQNSPADSPVNRP